MLGGPRVGLPWGEEGRTARRWPASPSRPRNVWPLSPRLRAAWGVWPPHGRCVLGGQRLLPGFSFRTLGSVCTPPGLGWRVHTATVGTARARAIRGSRPRPPVVFLSLWCAHVARRWGDRRESSALLRCFARDSAPACPPGCQRGASQRVRGWTARGRLCALVARGLAWAAEGAALGHCGSPASAIWVAVGALLGARREGA